MKRPSRPRDPAQPGTLVCDVLTGRAKIAKARASNQTPAERSSIARKAATARWSV